MVNNKLVYLIFNLKLCVFKNHAFVKFMYANKIWYFINTHNYLLFLFIWLLNRHKCEIHLTPMILDMPNIGGEEENSIIMIKILFLSTKTFSYFNLFLLCMFVYMFFKHEEIRYLCMSFMSNFFFLKKLKWSKKGVTTREKAQINSGMS